MNNQQLPIGARLTNKYSQTDVFVTGFDPLTQKYEAKRCTDFAVVYIGKNWSMSYVLKVEVAK